MEEPSTPSSDMWWRLMGDDPGTPRSQRTPITPKSFRSLWENPSAIPEEHFQGEHKDDDQIEQTSSMSKKRSTESGKRPTNSAETRNQSSSNLEYNESIGGSPRVFSRSLNRTPIDRVTVANLDIGLPTSPLSENSGRRTARGDDTFGDGDSYMGSAEKFLDAIEDRMCTLDINSPSISDIEKRIEASWKDIEHKTAEFFNCRKVCKESEMIVSDIRNPNKEDKKQASIFTIPYLGCNNGDTGDGGGSSPKGRPLKISPSENLRDEDYRDDEDAGSSTTDHDAKIMSRDNFKWSSHTMAFKGRNGALDIDAESRHVPHSESVDFDASTITTFRTQPTETLDPLFLTASSLVPPPPPQNERKPSRKASVTSADTALAIFEPTNPSALLVKQNNVVVIAPTTLVKSSASGRALKNHDSHFPDADSNFQKSCFSPKFRKSDSGSLAITNTSSTISTALSKQSKKTIDAKDEGLTITDQGESNFYHAYIAYYERGPVARKVSRLYEHPAPSAFPTLNGEIVVRIAYSTVSHTDCAVRRGFYWGDDSIAPLNLPIVPGVSFSGYVTQLNRASMRTGLRYGDRVISLVRVGANARHICISRDSVVKVPDELTDDKRIACLPEVYLGAFQVLHMGQRNGNRYKKTSLAQKTVLILGGATILGKALIELCNAAGAYTVYATGKDRHFTRIEAAKATPLNRDPRHWYSLLKGRIDLIIGLDNNTFGHSENSAQHLEVLSSKGCAILFGAPERTCDATLSDRKKIFVYNVFDSWEKDVKQGKRDLTHLCKLLLEGAIDPHVLETIPLCQIPQAQDAVEHRDFNSFLLCDPWMQLKRKATKALQYGLDYSNTADASVSTAIKSEKSQESHGTSSRPEASEARD